MLHKAPIWHRYVAFKVFALYAGINYIFPAIAIFLIGENPPSYHFPMIGLLGWVYLTVLLGVTLSGIALGSFFSSRLQIRLGLTNVFGRLLLVTLIISVIYGAVTYDILDLGWRYSSAGISDD